MTGEIWMANICADETGQKDPGISDDLLDGEDSDNGTNLWKWAWCSTTARGELARRRKLYHAEGH